MPQFHQNKEINEAVEYALDQGFSIHPAGRSAHIAYSLYCPNHTREGCVIRVFSTPRSPYNHAKRIVREVESCLRLHPRV